MMLTYSLIRVEGSREESEGNREAAVARLFADLGSIITSRIDWHARL